MEKHKHDHKMTKAIKGCIFGALMFAPLFAVLSTTLYATFNKNAKDSYSGTTQNEYSEILVDNISDLVINDTYLCDTSKVYVTSDTNIGAYMYKINLANFKLISTDVTLQQDYNNVIAFGPYYNISYNGQMSFQLFYEDGTTQAFNRGSSIRFTFSYLSNNLTYNWCSVNLLSTISYNHDFYLDNAFTYSINELKNNDLFNWSKDSELYTGIKTMTDGIGATNEIIPMLLTYWFILSVIYVIIDIIIECFTTLTHLLNYKAK